MALELDELASRIVRCIGIWETNRGGNDPAPKESALNTVCGVRASMATIEQATIPYAVDAILEFPDLATLASPNLTVAELTNAQDVCKGVQSLLVAVAGAFAAAKSPDNFIAQQATLIAAAGLTSDDVRRMFRAEALLATVKKLNAVFVQRTKGLDPQKDREKIRAVLAELADSIPSSDRLDLGASLVSYIRRPGIWGENGAGWKRKAVNAMANDVGARINTVAISQNGTALAFPTYRAKVVTRLDGQPIPESKSDLQPIVVDVAQTNNPNEAGYGLNVWKNYDRLYA